MLEKRRGTGHNNGDNTETTFSKKAESGGGWKSWVENITDIPFFTTHTHTLENMISFILELRGNVGEKVRKPKWIQPQR